MCIRDRPEPEPEPESPWWWESGTYQAYLDVPEEVLNDINTNNTFLKNSHLYGTGLLSSLAEDNDLVAEFPPKADLANGIGGYTLMITLDYTAGQPMPDTNDTIFAIREAWPDRGTSTSVAKDYYYCYWHTNGKPYMKGRRDYITTNGNPTTSMNAKWSDHMGNDERFVLVFRSGDATPANPTGCSLDGYKASDFLYNFQRPTTLSTTDTFSRRGETYKLHTTLATGHELWINRNGVNSGAIVQLSLIHISEPTRPY